MKSIKSIFVLTVLFVLTLRTFNSQAQSIAAGGWHSLAICNDSTVKAFGENASGQLGDGTTTDRNTPVTVVGLSGIVAVSGGGDQLEAHSVALKRNGTVWSWGSNLYGGLGNGSTVNSSSPVQASGLSGVTQISAGGWHTTALKNDGTVWTWGWNADGQLGIGNTTDKYTPQQVPGLTGVIKIASGTYHTLALKSDGSVWAWGDNISGQIGDGSTTDRTSPVQVTGLTNIRSITAGRFFSLAIKNDGTVWTWGENLYGQLGDGTTTDKSTAVQVSGLTNVIEAVVATGAFHCLALKSDNTVWSWGRNTYGNLGDGTVTNRSTPVQVTGIAAVKGMAAGTNFSLFYKNDGTFWACGRNASGQLGDGTVTQRNNVTQATGLCSVLQPVGIFENNQVQSITVCPNPSVNGRFNIHIENSSDVQTIKIIDLSGKTVWNQTTFANSNDTPTEIDLSFVESGVYVMMVLSNKGIVVEKLIKN